MLAQVIPFGVRENGCGKCTYDPLVHAFYNSQPIFIYSYVLKEKFDNFFMRVCRERRMEKR